MASPEPRRPSGVRAWIRAGLGGALVLAPGALAGPVERLDRPLRTPVYRVPDGATLADASYDYSVRWSGLVVGHATVTLRSEPGPGALAVDLRGGTQPVIDWLYRYRVRAHGRVGTAPFAPDHFVIEQCERGRHERTEIRFPADGSEVRSTRERKGRVRRFAFESDNTFDIPSATFLLLSLDYAPGARYELDTFTGKDRHLLLADVQGRERIEAAGATHDAWRLRLETRHLTNERNRGKHRETTVWVSAQRPRHVLLARSDTFVGPLTLELEGRVAGAAPMPATAALASSASCI